MDPLAEIDITNSSSSEMHTENKEVNDIQDFNDVDLNNPAFNFNPYSDQGRTVQESRGRKLVNSSMKSRNDEGPQTTKRARAAMPESDQRLSTANEENINDTSRATPRIAVNNTNNQQKQPTKQPSGVHEYGSCNPHQVLVAKDSFSNYNSVTSKDQ